ncbi:conserved hypothetical protein [Candidatus Methylobacter favarea]|uniref:DUF3987 domain-containing protein n=1 Tax=Candidatus Methylobacter favarea TaxID=2707345 RepID=A0A8S0W9I1_9GAMM|nr:hypothetical protein [Candidatus Methylobacter favarea]CAA9889976.1 conserved hypothetical protein [Candidatus Methylobacter favarea]
MDAAGYHGILSDIVTIATASSEASKIAVAANFLGSFSALIGRGAYQYIGDGICHARPFFLLVGRTGKSRKGTSEYTVRRIFDAAEALLEGHLPPLKRHEGGLSTGEGLGWSIRDKVEDDDGGDNGGTTDKRLYVVEAEFASAMAAASRDKCTLSPTIRMVWDGKTIAPLVKNAAWAATDPHVVINGHITAAELLAKMTDVDALSGFLNRFVILHVVRPKLVPLPRRTEKETIENMAKQVAEAVRFAIGDDVTAGNTLAVTLSPDAVKFWCGHYPALTAEEDGIAGALLVRTEIYCRMLAMIFALLDGTALIEPPHIDAALAWVNYWRDSVRYIFCTLAAKAEAERLQGAAADILEFIGLHPGCSRTDITNAFKNRNSSQEIAGALNHLMNSAPPMVKFKKVPRPDGKAGSRKILYWVT